MLRSQTVLTIHDLHTQEKTVQEIAQELHIWRPLVLITCVHRWFLSFPSLTFVMTGGEQRYLPFARLSFYE